VLAWQARLERLIEETNDLRRTQRGRSQSEYQIGLMIRGMETQLAEWEARIERPVASNTSVRIGVLFTRVFLSGAPLLKLPSVKLVPSLDPASTFRADRDRLMGVVPALHEIYEFFLALDPAEVNSFIGVEWGALILSVILGFRMSLPLVLCPEWDDRAAREAVRFGEYIDRFCQMGGEDVREIDSGLTAAAAAGGPGASGAAQKGRSMDVLSASKIVLEMVKKKFRRRVARLEGKQLQQQQQQQQLQEAELMLAAPPHPRRPGAPASLDPAVSGCPMMDGSLEPYYPYWDETFNSNLVGSGFGIAGAQGTGQAELDASGASVPNDLWAAMTMGWVTQGDVNFDAL